MRKHLPGGARTGAFGLPHPIYCALGAGPVAWDIDGSECVDFNNCLDAVMHGHAHPAIVRAIGEQASRGTMTDHAVLGHTGIDEESLRCPFG